MWTFLGFLGLSYDAKLDFEQKWTKNVWFIEKMSGKLLDMKKQ